MIKKVVATSAAPQAIGPYSQAIIAGGFVFCSGQVSLIPESGELVEGGIEAQTRQVLDNLKNVLKAADSSLEGVVKTTVFLKSMDDFAVMNEVYAEYFKDNKPARATVEVSRLPKDVMVEIDCIALVD